MSRIAAFLVAALFGAATLIHSQNITGSIVGTITDSTGAVVPGAQITVKNLGTGQVTQTTAGASGAYSVPNLLAGTYEVSAAATGFQSVKTSGIQLLTAQTVRQDLTLQVGAVQQTVEVSAQAAVITTDSQTIGGTITSHQIEQLPFTGQAIDGLIALAPGVVSSGSNPRISGSQYWGGNNFTLNGVSVDDVGNGGAAYTYNSGPGLNMSNLPPIESLQEFKVASGDQNAEFKGVATVTMVTKAGTNSFHGGAYEYFQNRELNANTFLLNAAGKSRPGSNLNQFGAYVGGPAIKNKIFVFGDYFGVRRRTASTVQTSLPSMAERGGDFSALCSGFDANGLCTGGTQLYNPFTGQPFQRNQIPANLISPQSQTLLPFLPTPTNPLLPGLPNGPANYTVALPNVVDINTIDFRVDAAISDKDAAYGIFHRSKGNPYFLAGPDAPNYGNQTNMGYTDYDISATETHTFGPTAINDLRAAWVVHSSYRTGQNTDFAPWSLWPNFPVSDNGGLPTIGATGYSGLWYDYGKGYPFPEYDIEIQDNFTKVKGSHTFKAGIDETGYKNYVRQGGPALSVALGNPLGTVNFTGVWTGNKGWPGQPQSAGNAFADFLLGTAVSSQFAGPLTEIVTYSRDWEFYLQDTWQATPKLTINYGIRYMYQAPWQVRDNRVSYFDPSNGKLALPENSDTATTPPLAIGRLMGAYPFETTKNAGWPTSYFTPDKNNWGPRFGFAYRPFTSNRTVVRGGYGVYYNFIPGFIGEHENIFNPPWRDGSGFNSRLPGNPTTTYLPDLLLSNPFPSGGANAPPSNPLIYYTEQNLLNTVVQQWNFTIEQQIGKDWGFRASYVGAQTHHALLYGGDINKPGVQTPNVPIQAQRPYQPWSNIYGIRTPGKVNFEQLQLEATKRYSMGLSFQVEYAFTRSLDNVPTVGSSGNVPQNPQNLNADYGESEGIPRQNLVFNWLYELPYGRGRRFGSHMNRVLDAVLGGWGVSGISTYRTGVPFSVNFAVPANVIGWFGGRADRVAGAQEYVSTGGSHNIVAGVPYFDPNSFAPPAKWQYGNSERNLLFGPGFWNWDLGAQKYFHITEAHRVELRADFLNAFNHMNLGNPNATIADTRDGGPPNPLAGMITGTANLPRVIQLGLKYQF